MDFFMPLIPHYFGNLDVSVWGLDVTAERLNRVRSLPPHHRAHIIVPATY